MDREIKFRGKRLDNAEFVYGHLVIEEATGKYFIVLVAEESTLVHEEGCLKCCSCEVDEITVGQYTGLKDKNGKEIYDGEILSFTEYPGENYYAEICKSEEPPFNFIYGYKKKPNSECSGISHNIYYNLNDVEDLGEIKAIGNIYDNPELLEVNK